MIKLGILGGADIAYRMFMPAVNEMDNIICAGVASNNSERRKRFEEKYNVTTFNSYQEIICNSEIDAVYIPLPPSEHYKWAKMALENNKHVFLEKPSTTSYELSKDLVELSNKNNLVLHENYMFQYHSQLDEINKIIESGVIGKVRLYRGSFGFPKRDKNDFRYNKELGGGALMDAGGYVTKLATLLLGKSIKVCAAQTQNDSDYSVDIFDSVLFKNDEGLTFQGSFGMDCHYKCELEVWGSKGRIQTGRIFTAPVGYVPSVIIEDNEGQRIVKLKDDCHFKHSIEHFCIAIDDNNEKEKLKESIILQAKLIETIKEKMGE